MVTAVLCMTALLGISALVVDLGFGLQKRRQVQNSADAAALGATQDLPALDDSVTAAQSLTSDNLPGATLGWDACSDPKHLTFVSESSECISFDTSFTRVRVKIPQQTYDTYFARVLGIDTISTTGAATARLVGAGFGSIQPFALYSGFQSGLACLKQGPSGHSIETCDEPETGNFNLLDITQYGNDTLGTPRNCGNSAQRQRMADNIAIGADHGFTLYEGFPVVDACDTPGPNTLPPRTGNDVDAFDLGLVHGSESYISDGGGGRLRRGDFDKVTMMGVELDNTPLWEFIPQEELEGVPDSCQRATFDQLLVSTPAGEQQAVMTAALDTCFTEYAAQGSTGELLVADTDPFGEEVPNLYDIQLSPRLAYVPQFVQTDPPSGSSENLNIAAFRPVYIFEVFAKCSSRGNCDVAFTPGPWNTTSQGAANDKAQAMTAWVFPLTMLPVGLQTNPSAIGQNNYVQLVE